MIWTFDWYAPQARHPLFLAFVVILIPLSIVGLWRLIRTKETRPAGILFLLFAAMYTALFTLTHVEARYQIYMLAVLLPVASSAFSLGTPVRTKP